ncbi:hypothetical protein CGRA01v4_13016 [Colletotrichum graminicola]|nr:hypothetical protein CGRA01v4_13016 [Colletotrichum graminicola]
MVHLYSMLWNCRNCNDTSRDHMVCRSYSCPVVGKDSRPSIEGSCRQIRRSRPFRRHDRCFPPLASGPIHRLLVGVAATAILHLPLRS